VSWESGKPSQNENEYFAKRDAEWIRERRAALDRERADREKTHQRPKCPRCAEALDEREFRNVKLDVCAKGHGVWFDPGELEMVLHMPRAELLRIVSDVETARSR
jgi:hypothetical protein